MGHIQRTFNSFIYFTYYDGIKRRMIKLLDTDLQHSINLLIKITNEGKKGDTFINPLQKRQFLLGEIN